MSHTHCRSRSTCRLITQISNNSMKKNLFLIIVILLSGIQLDVAQKKQPSDYYFRQAEELYENDGNPQKILHLLDLQLEEVPHHVDALFLRLCIHTTQERYDLALQDINRAIACYKPKRFKHPESALYLWRGMIYARQFEDMNQALADLDTACRLSAHDRDGLKFEILHERAQIHYKLGNYTRSDTDYRSILNEDSTNQAAILAWPVMDLSEANMIWLCHGSTNVNAIMPIMTRSTISGCRFTTKQATWIWQSTMR